MSRLSGRLHAVILAGGTGERLWPLSRGQRPKPLLQLSGGHSLLEGTLARVRRFAPADRTWLVCARDQARVLRPAAGLPPRHVLLEPRRRNTAMAVALAAWRIAADDPEALMAVLPADHVIPDARAFASQIRRAARAAEQAEVLLTLGVRPTRPEPGYGYIRLGRAVGSRHPGLHQVRRFVEKLGRSEARRLLRQGGYRWNAGIFVWKARTLLEEIAEHAPRLHRALAPLRKLTAPGGRGARSALEAAYQRAPSASIDTALLEHSRRLWCLPVDFAWSDVGSWESLAQLLGVDRDVTRIMQGEVVMHEAKGNLVWASDRPVALLGVEGLAVIDAGDALLVTRLDRSAELREVVARLRSRGRNDLL